jgi:hypothetical protein
MTREKIIVKDNVVYFLYDNNTAIINEYRGDLSVHLDIPREIEGHLVVGVRVFAFAHCDTVTSIVFPDTVVDIADYAFYDCSNLHTVTFMAKTIQVQDWAFAHCHNLKTVYGNEIVSARCSFANCHALEIIEADFVGNLNFGLFYHCRKLNRIFFGKNVKIVADLFDGVYHEKLNIYFQADIVFHEKHQKVLDWPTITVIKGVAEEC